MQTTATATLAASVATLANIRTQLAATTEALTCALHDREVDANSAITLAEQVAASSADQLAACQEARHMDAEIATNTLAQSVKARGSEAAAASTLAHEISTMAATHAASHAAELAGVRAQLTASEAALVSAHRTHSSDAAAAAKTLANSAFLLAGIHETLATSVRAREADSLAAEALAKSIAASAASVLAASVAALDALHAQFQVTTEALTVAQVALGERAISSDGEEGSTDTRIEHPAGYERDEDDEGEAGIPDVCTARAACSDSSTSGGAGCGVRDDVTGSVEKDGKLRTRAAIAELLRLSHKDAP